jgi:hypothetical protein
LGRLHISWRWFRFYLQLIRCISPPGSKTLCEPTTRMSQWELKASAGEKALRPRVVQRSDAASSSRLTLNILWKIVVLG